MVVIKRTRLYTVTVTSLYFFGEEVPFYYTTACTMAPSQCFFLSIKKYGRFKAENRKKFSSFKRESSLLLWYEKSHLSKTDVEKKHPTSLIFRPRNLLQATPLGRVLENNTVP